VDAVEHAFWPLGRIGTFAITALLGVGMVRKVGALFR
jgi:hypothetical protein